MDQSLVFDIDLIRRYDKEGPRYTSYPTAPQFHDGFDEVEYRRIAKASNAAGGPLSLYFHIPFCDTVCYYCGCNKVVTKHRDRAAPYLERLHKEIAMQAALFDSSRVVEQLHWGGGTPTFISHDEMRTLMGTTREHFTLLDDDTGEYSIEIDPREARPDTIALLRELGFNRMSMGVQDFDPAVQKAVNRIQSLEETTAVANAARANGFKSLSIDLIYGLPHQSLTTFEDTLDKVLEMDPDRLSVFNYAHLPHLFMPQRRINEAELPSGQAKLDILQYIIGRLTDAGYVFIGMDHFAKPDDELSRAQREHSLYRNFQGYSTHAECDLIGLGVTSIGKVGNTYGQNRKDMDSYYQAIDAGHIPVFRGIELSADDVLRREVITQLICHFELRYAEIEERFGINFAEYFAIEIPEVEQMVADGLVKVDAQGIEVMPAGRLLIRNVCMPFDRYLRERREQRFSKVI
ncbi:MAG: oxygen-independent coproporphyrinogen III oxidase [Gammaproteobacteria bacterium]|nr:oxygen-independent coproporphyrinogen III oxidase [Gammaproteobacteria bacterium]MCP5136149.1 oxygen-independent coproporphyrinogen III oxidase [Gammaproteobacteria bacterium]